jgi:hypothetical membrane protein
MVNKILSPRKQDVSKSWSSITVLGIIMYVFIDIELFLLRPDYSLLHNAESDYGRGPYFWLMDINFLLRCFLSLALAKAILTRFPKNKPVRRACTWLIVWAAASGLLAFFADNPTSYPKLWSGSVHLLLAFIDFIAIVVAMILFSRLTSVMKLTRISTYLLIGLSAVAVIALILMGHAGVRPHSLGGLYERIFLGAVLMWEAVLALSLGERHKVAPAALHSDDS